MAENTHRHTQRVARLQSQGSPPEFAIEATDIPSLGPHEVLVELEVTGICGTDLALASGHLGPCNPILGHEGVGQIVAVGPMCSSRTAVLGQRVGVGWIRDACGSCRVCKSGAGQTRCMTQVFSGRDVPGTMAQFTVVPERYITTLPDDVASELLAPIMCAGVTAYKAIKVAQAVPGSWLLISGAGGSVGGLALQYAKAMGYRAVAVDVGEERRKTCVDAGAEVYLDYEKEGDLRAATISETDGHLCSAAIVCAGSARAYEAALSCLDYYGTLVAVGIPPPTSKPTFHPLTLIDYGIKIVGSITGDREDISEASQFLRRGLVKPKVVSIDLKDVEAYLS
ncbi:uncharacterized protein N7459_008949 [Penicillium hispanicum]|uniref:uncharacterized protein n=1 Tax=Penicillium hispanicum TaxID=1080232 RepID=UPI002540CB2D|nr:uncharacterized protein N7459_008949 [Penicillium hispanicum]KAJ5569519.1 hypothetical protein N7459_008949 [Penicillium hispanicum]